MMTVSRLGGQPSRYPASRKFLRLGAHLNHESAKSDEAKQLYLRVSKKRGASTTIPAHPLLHVPSHTAREFDKDLEAAGIEKHTVNGKLDFHACRVAYINQVLDSGVSVKEAQALARHSTPEMTMNVYGRVLEDRLADAVEQACTSKWWA
jgi:integrase